MALRQAVAQHKREGRGHHGKQAQTKPVLTFSAAGTTHVPSTVPSAVLMLFPPPLFIALSQFFVPQPHVLIQCQHCVHCDCTNSLQMRNLCYLLAAGTLWSLLLAPR